MKLLKLLFLAAIITGVFVVFRAKNEPIFGGVQYINITGHVMSTGTTPTLVAGGTGYSGSVLPGSTDFKGSISGAVPGGAGQLQVKFVSAYNYAPVCIISLASAQPTTTFYVTSSVSGMGLNFIAGNVSGTKQFNYICIQ